MEYAAKRPAINAKLIHLFPNSFARQVDIFLTQTIAVSFTSVLETQPRNILAPPTMSTAIRRILA
jgi:hypothetical protein